MDEEQRKLWREFNLAEKNPAQGGGILYCLRYSKEHLEAQQEVVVGALDKLRVCIKDLEESRLGIDVSRAFVEDRTRVFSLLEELSVVNEALEYNAAGFSQYKNVSELADGLIIAYLDRLDAGSQVESYELVDRIIPQIVRDLRITGAQGKKFSKREKEKIQELRNFAGRQSDHLNDPRGYVIFG